MTFKPIQLIDLTKAARWLRSVVERILAWGSPVASFRPVGCIEKQQVDFSYCGQSIRITADYSTPLYETVAEIVDYDCYSLELLPEKVDGLILDAGANIGVASLVLAARFKGTVLALEPIENNFRILQANLAANQGMNIQPVRAALAPFDGELRLWQDRGYSVSARQWQCTENLSLPSWVEHAVPALSLESLMKLAGAKQVGLLKMDIEGGEHPWLNSMTSATAAPVQCLTMEVHERGRDGGIRTVRRRLRDLGFRFREKPEMFGRRALCHVFAWRE